MRTNSGYASTTIEGDGRYLRLMYDASDPLTMFFAPMVTKETFNPADYVVATLPAGTGSDVRIDLAVAPGWKPVTRKYLFNILAPRKETTVAMHSSFFEPWSVGVLPLIALRQAWQIEPFSPSSFHALRGYRMFGIATNTIAGIVLWIVAGVILVRRRKTGGAIMIIGVTAAFVLLSGMHAGIDQLRLVREHVGSMLSDGTYDEAGSSYDIAETITMLREPHDNVVVCRTGANLREKILRYMLYPLRVTSAHDTLTDSSLIVVSYEAPWQMKNDVLTCNDITARVKKLREFSDGSLLFSVVP